MTALAPFANNTRLVALAAGDQEPKTHTEAAWAPALRDGWLAAADNATAIPFVGPSPNDVGVEAFDLGLRTYALAHRCMVQRVNRSPIRLATPRAVMVDQRPGDRLHIEIPRANFADTMGTHDAIAVIDQAIGPVTDTELPMNLIAGSRAAVRQLVTTARRLDARKTSRQPVARALAAIRYWETMMAMTSSGAVIVVPELCRRLILTANPNTEATLDHWIDNLLDARPRTLCDQIEAIANALCRRIAFPSAATPPVERTLWKSMAWAAANADRYRVINSTTNTAAFTLTAAEAEASVFDGLCLSDTRWRRRAHWSGDVAAASITSDRGDRTYTATIYGTMPPRFKVGRKLAIHYGADKAADATVKAIHRTADDLCIDLRITTRALIAHIDSRLGHQTVPIELRPTTLSRSAADNLTREAKRALSSRNWLTSDRVAPTPVHRIVPAWVAAAAAGAAPAIAPVTTRSSMVR